jgi:hypothetical protein
MKTDTARDHDSTVEGVWVNRLGEEGVSESAAERITAGLQATPDVALGSLPADKLEERICSRIDELDLEGRDIKQPEAVRDDMKQALRAGIEGDLDGPAALVPPSQHPTGPPDEENIPDKGTMLTELVNYGTAQEGGSTPTVVEQDTINPGETDVAGAGAGQGAAGADGDTGVVPSGAPKRQGGQESNRDGDEETNEHSGQGTTSGQSAPTDRNTRERRQAQSQQDTPPERSGQAGQSTPENDRTEPQQGEPEHRSSSKLADSGLDDGEEEMVDEELRETGNSDANTDNDPQEGRSGDIPSLQEIAVHIALQEQSEELEEELGRQKEALIPVLVRFAERSVGHYEDMVQSSVFYDHSPAERQVLYEKLVEDPAVRRIPFETDEQE